MYYYWNKRTKPFSYVCEVIFTQETDFSKLNILMLIDLALNNKVIRNSVSHHLLL